MKVYALSILKIPAVVRLIRVKQWVKNAFLFIPLFFAGQLFNLAHVIALVQGFLAFSFVASAIYIINDYNDIEADRKHPEKRTRPLASGEISVPFSFIIMGALLITGFAAAFFLNFWFVVILGTYFLFNVAYSFGLKHIALVDLFIIAFGFVLRTVSGGVIVHVPISQWLVIMIFLLALFLALAKRRDDLILQKESGKSLRKSTVNYNLEFLGSCLTLISAIIMVSYIMYTISPDVTERLGTSYLYLTGVFVIAGMMRYLQITMVENNSGSPTKILYKDNFIRITILAWIVSFYVILYLPKL